MEDLQTILDRVLAGVGEMVAERKALIRKGSCAPGHGFAGEDGTNSAMQKICGTDTLAGMTYPPCGAPVTAGGVLSETRGPQSPSGDPATGEKVAGDTSGQCLKPSVMPFTTDDTLPAQRVTARKTSAGDKWDEPSVVLEMPGGVHASTAMMQAITGRPITARDSQE